MLYTARLQVISLFTPPRAIKPASTLCKFLLHNFHFMKSWSLLWICNTIQCYFIASESKGIPSSCPPNQWKIRQRAVNIDPQEGPAKANSFVWGLFQAVLFFRTKLTPAVTIPCSETALCNYWTCVPLNVTNT